MEGNFLKQFKNRISDALWIGALNKLRTRMGWRAGWKYQRHYNKAKSEYRSDSIMPSGVVVEAAQQYINAGWAAFAPPKTQEYTEEIIARLNDMESQSKIIWDEGGRFIGGDLWGEFPSIGQIFAHGLGDFIELAMGSNYKIFYGLMYKSERYAEEPTGSQLWHADGGPGTCMNLMLCLTGVSHKNGAMELLDRKNSLRIFHKERAAVRRISRELFPSGKPERSALRSPRAKWIQGVVESEQLPVHQPEGPSGMMLAFNNNLIHRGGFVQKGHKRIVCIFHIYPSIERVPYSHYRMNGIGKTAPYPARSEF